MTPKHADHYARAMTRIPWATQTNAKRWRPEYGEAMPPFIKRAQGCRIWDLDDREYIDFRCALGPIILGYRCPEVESAVRVQLNSGVLFSMASPLELEAAEAFCLNVPWVEQIRFMKTGADACTSCVRLARVYTGREHILTCGYHGYHDWSALSWPNPGVPRVLHDYVHEIKYGDLEAVKRVFSEHGHELAGAIAVPYEWNEDTGEKFIALLRSNCDHYGAVLIFDEVLTGFRLARGGAQEYYGIAPDLAAFAKAMANGYPVSAFAGKREFMQMLDQTIITTTYAGELLSLAACKATMAIMREQPVHDHIKTMGKRLQDGFQEIINATGLPAHAAGLPPAPFIQFDGASEQENVHWQNRLFAQLFALGVFPSERWFINYSHQPADIDQTLEKLHKAAQMIC
ncbi:MAG: aspartate aminotransferase family protein [bacterium]